jgi:cytoskeleton protein RodZ
MTEQSGGTTAEAQVEPLTPGKLLRRERERRALSVQQAAEDLHLDASTVEAIEADRFIALGAPVYAKGHLRKYATLLGLSADDVIRRYEALSDTPIVPDPIPTTVAVPAERPRPSLKVPIWIVVALIAVAVAVWVYREFSNPVVEPPSSQSVAPQVVEPEPTVAQELEPAPPAASEGGVPAQSAPTVPERAAATRTEPAASIGNEPATTAEPVRLRLEFNDSSWAEIVDATGRRLMFGTGEPGRVRTLQGVPPIRVTFGLASAVDLQVNDRPTLVPRRAGRDSARFVIEADGVVR